MSSAARTADVVGVFGRVRLGYVLVQSMRMDAWRRFGVEGLGLHMDGLAGGGTGFRIDAHQRRLIVVPGGAEDVEALGWQVDDRETLDMIVARLGARGVRVEQGSAAEADLRGVDDFVRFVGPKKQAMELFTRPVISSEPLSMRASGFVTGASGMGHLAIVSREPEAFQIFWQEVFDARVSDRIEDRLNGVDMDFTFLRLNERHHTVAIASTRSPRLNPMRNKIHHLNLQAAALEDVISAYLRCRGLGVPIASAIGQHPNDKELSFYAVTPSGFEMELGWNPIVVTDEPGWSEGRYRGISRWGHFPENLTLGLKLSQLGRGLWSLTRPEHVVGKSR